ncbi:MAG TPA: response regulator [Bryobacteraceae bacterium]|nr:response regulator [Bryobacteraceae bacterium]
MPPRFTILIADRNPNVRGFLQREMNREGYAVRPAESADELVRLAQGAGPVHLVILDPDLPGVAPPALLQELQERLPRVPVVLHTLDPLAAYAVAPRSPHPTLVVEKTGSSIVRLKQVAAVLAAGRPAPVPSPKKS